MGSIARRNASDRAVDAAIPTQVNQLRRGASLRGCARRTSTFETVAFGGASARFFWISRSGGNRRLFASASIADARLSLKDDWQSSAEAYRLSKDAGRSSKASKRSSNGASRHPAGDAPDGSWLGTCRSAWAPPWPGHRTIRPAVPALLIVCDRPPTLILAAR